MRNSDNNNLALVSCAIEHEKIEQMVTKFWTHHCAFDFDQKFCEAHVKDIMTEAKKQGGSDAPVAASFNAVVSRLKQNR
jgi:hypothetical protein